MFLSALAPGRVDLGIGKAPGGLPLSTRALQYGTVNNGKDFFPNGYLFLLELIRNSVDNSHPLAGIQATPIPQEKNLKFFLLGASARGLYLADTTEEAIKRYRPYYDMYMSTDASKFNQSPFTDLEDHIQNGSA
ncbi:hypothetical protein GCM10020331_099970 [Ectobacillus funiculus]